MGSSCRTLLLLFLLPLLLTDHQGLGDVSTKDLMKELQSRAGVVGGEEPVEPSVEDTCKELLNKFSQSSSDFTRCANQYAKPIFMCRKCVQDFINVRKYYKALEHSETEGINCKDVLTSQDKVEIIKATYEYIVGKKGLWSKAFCSSCYTSPLTNKSRLTEKTVEFFALSQSVQDCFNAHPNQSMDQSKSEACIECQIDYGALNAFYKEELFKAQFPYLDGICFDIVDTMNTTQRRWGSGHFDCGRRMRGNAPLIIAVVCVLLCPSAFYLLARCSQEAAGERTVVQPHMTDIITREERLYRPSLEQEVMETTGEAAETASVETMENMGEVGERDGAVANNDRERLM